MKTKTEIIRTGICIALLSILSWKPVNAQSSKDQVQLESILNSMNKRVYGLLKLSKKARESQTNTTFIEKVRIVSLGCPLITDPQGPISLPDELLQSQEFEILDYQNRHFQIKTTSGQTGWVSESCTEKFLVDDNLLRQNALSQEYNLLNKLAQETYLAVVVDFGRAEKFKKSIVEKLGTGTAERLNLERIYGEILLKKGYADNLFERYFQSVIDTEPNKENILRNLSIKGQLALGSSNFTKSYSAFDESVNKTGNTDFKLNLKYNLDNTTSLTLDAGKRQESLQSIYNNGFAGIGFQKKLDKLDVGISARFNNYDDQFREINSYKRLNLNTNIVQEVNDKVVMNYRYNLLNNSFKNKTESNYSRHALQVKSQIKTNGSSIFEIDGTADISNSELSFFKYKRFKPQLSHLSRNLGGGQNRLTLYAEIFSFDLVPIRSNNKYFVGVNSSKPSEDNSHTKNSEASLLYRHFANNQKNNFYQLKLGKGRRIFGKGNKQVNTQFITRYFPDNLNFSHADLHFDYQTNSTAYYSLTGNLRYWYPGEQNFLTTDLYAKVGLKIKTFSISPTLGFHANTDLKAEEIGLKKDKNNLRAGLEGRGNLLIAKIVRWSFRAAYEYGFVYNAAVESFGNLGEIVYGEVLTRNPYSLQLQSDVSAQIFRQAEVFGSFRYFNYETDIISELSISPVTNNNRLSAQLGVRLRYN